MSHVYPVTSDHPFCGTWSAMWPDESAEYFGTEFTISVVRQHFHVTGVDRNDGEAFVIYDVTYDGEALRFASLMPSTGRRGLNWMRLVKENQVEYEFTFTERELWVRKPTTPNIVPFKE